MSSNNIGKWDEAFKNLPSYPSAFKYGETLTYEMAADFLKDCHTVEDWGVGGGGFLKFRPNAIGVDGSDTPFAEKKYIDLVEYTSNIEGVHIRHVLEHNYEWKSILKNALKSATKKVAITLFIPLNNRNNTIELAYNLFGTNVPNLSISEKEFMDVVNEFNYKDITRATFSTNTYYSLEEIIHITL